MTPQLKALLPHLANLNKKRRDFRPVFRTLNEAKGYTETIGGNVDAIWAVNHNNIDASLIAGYSVTEGMD